MDNPQKTHDVAVLGWWHGKNYGSILTYYGLHQSLKNLGNSVLMVHEALGYNGYRVSWPSDILSLDFARRMGYDFTTQVHYSKLKSLNDVADTFIVGSDQLWNPMIGRVNDDLFLDFVSPENTRIAYATSFGNKGLEKFKPPFVQKHSQNLQKFKAISVREGYAVDTARDAFNVQATLVVDPVFLLPQEHYAQLATKATLDPTGDFLTVFFLDPTPGKVAVAQSIANKLGLDKIVVVPNPDGGRQLVTDLFQDEKRAEIIGDDRPENFLRCYQKAKYVLTDSFHGSAFAAIFERPFSSIYNTHRGADRFKNLLGSMGFGDNRRLLETDDNSAIANNTNVALDVDFSKARAYIANGRASSLQWLKAALAKDTKMTAALALNNINSVQNPRFTSSNEAWKISHGPHESQLAVMPGGAVRGNQVWCDLPYALRSGSAYRLKIDWTPSTTAAAINLHVRNPETGKFRVIGKVSLNSKSSNRLDIIPFLMPESGYSQLMLGAVHFTGSAATANVRSIELEEIPTNAINLEAKPSHTPGSYADLTMTLALHDQERLIRVNKNSDSACKITSARARIMFHAHALEKGLSRESFRPGFGKIAIPGLAKELNIWVSQNQSIQDAYVQSALAVMKTYFDRHASLNKDVSEFRQKFNPEVQKLIDACTHQEGGVLAARLPRETPANIPNSNQLFMDVVYGRRSIREFTNLVVNDQDVRNAVQIAMQSPSVCNRQGARVHQFRDKKIIAKLLELQGGFSGYEMPPRLLLVTADLNAFLFATERNQPFIDGGLFMMSLLLGLTQVGLGSCSLNTAMGIDREKQIRKIINIPDNEVFISFIAVGHFDPNIPVPRSKRVSIDQVLLDHKK